MFNSRPEFEGVEYEDGELKAVISDEYLNETIAEESGINMRFGVDTAFFFWYDNSAKWNHDYISDMIRSNGAL